MREPPPEVTIVTRTQDRPQLLSRCVASVLAQSFPAWRQVIVNDGGRRAEVEEAIKEHSAAARGRIELRHLETSRGMEAAANEGFKDASTPFCTLLDDDDSWDPAFLECTVRELHGCGDRAVQGIVTRTQLVEERLEDGAPVELLREDWNPQLLSVGLDELTLANMFTNNAFVFTRQAYDALGGFDEELRVYGDWDFNLRFLMRYNVQVLPAVLARYHRRTKSADNAALNSFDRIPAAAERFRAVLVNKWLRGDDGRSTAIGLLLARGRADLAQRRMQERLEKYLNALHRIRNLRLLKVVEQVILGSARPS